MIIDVQFDSSTTGAPAGFFTAVNAAVEFWEREIINPIRVTIVFGYNKVDGQVIGGNALAESESQGIHATFAQVKAGLAHAATSANDTISLAHLPSTDPTGGAGYFVPLAEAEVMGLFSTASTTVGFAGISSSFPFTFDPYNRSVSGDFDAIGALEHEISEVLGRIAESGTLQSNVAQYSPLDLFRYVSPGQLALTPVAAGFSIDGGATLLAPFNNPTSGNDAGDWTQAVTGDSFGFGARGVAGLVTTSPDLVVMDVLGFKLAPNPNARNDFLADGKSDFLIRSTSSQAVVVGEVSGGQAGYTSLTTLGSNWILQANGDLLGHGRADFLMQDGPSGGLFVGEVINGQPTYSQIGGLGPQWVFHGTGDFLGDTRDDFLIQDSNAGTVVVGEVVNGQAAYTLFTSLGANWSIREDGNFLGHGRSGFLMQDGPSGGLFITELVNGQPVYTPVGGLSADWKFVGAGNFLGDGKTDALIQSASTGAVVFGEVVNGQEAYTFVTTLGSQWKFVGTGDYFGEGHDQFLIENTTSGSIQVADWTGGQLHLTQVSGLGPEWAFH